MKFAIKDSNLGVVVVEADTIWDALALYRKDWNSNPECLAITEVFGESCVK